MTQEFRMPEPPDEDESPLIPPDAPSNPDERQEPGQTPDSGEVPGTGVEQVPPSPGEEAIPLTHLPVNDEAGEIVNEAHQEGSAGELPDQEPAAPPPTTEMGVQRLEEPPLSQQDERTWSMLAHLSILLNPITLVLGPVAALIIYLAYKDRSRLVAFHAMQSFLFQLVTWIGAGLLIVAIWVFTVMLIPVFGIGVICIPFSALITLLLIALPIIGLVYAIIGAIKVNNGEPFSYWLVGDWVRGTLA